MFGFLKEKLKSVFKKADTEEKKIVETSKIKEEIEEEEHAEIKEQEICEKSLGKKPAEEIKGEKKGFFKKLKEKIISKKLSSEKFDELFNELELILMENNVAVEVIEKIKQDLKTELVEKPLSGKLSAIIKETLKKSIDEILSAKKIDLIGKVKGKQEKPYVICFLGINGSGKTTTIAKIANLLKENHLKCLLVAGDTWRAASIQQLEEHARRLDIGIIKHNYGSDPAAVAFDGIKSAKAKNIDVVLIDTAGRQHANVNLMKELEKIVRVNRPDFKIFVGEAITGNDCVEQVKNFDKVAGIDGVILTKADIDEKGGAMISVSYVSKKPILFLGTGQKYSDLEEFDKEKIIKSLGL